MSATKAPSATAIKRHIKANFEVFEGLRVSTEAYASPTTVFEDALCVVLRATSDPGAALLRPFDERLVAKQGNPLSTGIVLRFPATVSAANIRDALYGDPPAVTLIARMHMALLRLAELEELGDEFVASVMRVRTDVEG